MSPKNNNVFYIFIKTYMLLKIIILLLLLISFYLNKKHVERTEDSWLGIFILFLFVVFFATIFTPNSGFLLMGSLFMVITIILLSISNNKNKITVGILILIISLTGLISIVGGLIHYQQATPNKNNFVQKGLNRVLDYDSTMSRIELKEIIAIPYKNYPEQVLVSKQDWLWLISIVPVVNDFFKKWQWKAWAFYNMFINGIVLSKTSDDSSAAIKEKMHHELIHYNIAQTSLKERKKLYNIGWTIGKKLNNIFDWQPKESGDSFQKGSELCNKLVKENTAENNYLDKNVCINLFVNAGIVEKYYSSFLIQATGTWTEEYLAYWTSIFFKDKDGKYVDEFIDYQFENEKLQEIVDLHKQAYDIILQ